MLVKCLAGRLLEEPLSPCQSRTLPEGSLLGRPHSLKALDIKQAGSSRAPVCLTHRSQSQEGRMCPTPGEVVGSPLETMCARPLPAGSKGAGLWAQGVWG